MIMQLAPYALSLVMVLFGLWLAFFAPVASAETPAQHSPDYIAFDTIAPGDPAGAILYDPEAYQALVQLWGSSDIIWRAVVHPDWRGWVAIRVSLVHYRAGLTDFDEASRDISDAMQLYFSEYADEPAELPR